MEIHDPNNERYLSLVGIRLTNEEARELRDSLDALLENPFPGRHEHVASADFQVEMSIWIADEEGKEGLRSGD